jgi:hypothetical protein
MRKKHQAVLISSAAKKNFCNEISLGNFTYESEVKEQLRDFFNNNISQEDVENQDEDNSDSSDEDFEVSNIKVPKQVINNTKEYAKFQISEKAVLSGIDPFNYETFPQKVINICYDNSEYTDDNNKDLGATIKFFDIIKQCIFWKEKGDSKGKKDLNIDCFQLFNLDPNKIKNIKEKLIEFKKIAKEKKLDGSDSIINKLLTELEGNFAEQKKELNNLISNLEYVDTVSYGNKWSVVGFQKVKIINQNENY